MPVETKLAAALEICSGDLSGQTHALGGRTVLGRLPSVDLVLDHASVSRRHAELETTEEGRWRIKDLDSRNGTTVNGSRITERTLGHGDLIGIGEVVLRFLDPTDASISGNEDAPGFTITTLGVVEPPRISAELIGATLAFGRSLQDVRDPEQRLRKLLEMAINPAIGGWWSYALRICKSTTSELQIQSLCPPASSPFGSSKDPHVSRSVLRAVLEGREPVVANRLARLTRFQAELTMAPGSESFSAVACPLRVAEGTADVLYVILPPAMGNVEWLMLISFAVEQYRHAQSAWEARTSSEGRAAVEREMDLARHVQAGTLPRRLDGAPLDWAARFDPCLAVAGDYVDVIERDDGTLLLLIADAAGKGMQAALITAGLHAIFHTQGRTAALPEVVEAADCYLRAFLPDGSFVTLAALLLDPRSGEAQCVNCGHPPILAVDRAGSMRLIEGGGNLPLAVCGGPIQSAPARIAPDEWIIGYTDGLSEMRDADGKMLGISALHEHIREISGAAGTDSAEALAQQIGQRLDSFRGSAPIADDRTLLVARRMIV